MLCILGLLGNSLYAQTPQNASKKDLQSSNENSPRCGTMEALEDRVQNDSEYAKFWKEAMAIPEQPSLQRIPCDGSNTIIIPVAFHFANNAVTGNCGNVDCMLTEVQDQLDALNDAFGDNTGTAAEAACPAAYEDANGNSVASTGTCIQFCMATPPAGGAADLDPSCDPPITIGVFNGGLNGGGNGAPGWNCILNIFITNGNCLGVADGIPGNANGDGVTVCSEAFGGAAPSAGCNLDDNNTFGLGATLIHEVGHYLGLFHVWGDGGCGTTDVNAPGPFNVNDTPDASGPSGGCPTGCQSTCGTPNPWANFMDYTDDACMSMFTEDQAQVMNYWANELFGGCAGVTDCATPATDLELTSLCEMTTCVVACATSVTTAADETADFCGTSEGFAFPNPGDLVVLDDDSDATYTWSTGGYLPGGTAVNAPTAVTSTDCAVATETYYINVGCNIDANLNLQGGTVTITVYPAPPADIADLVTITGEDGCTEPMVVAIAGCESFITVTPDPGNPAFPVNAGDAGTASYTVAFVPDPNGPDCCLVGNPADEGLELLTNGDFEAGVAPWTEVEEVPAGTPNPNPFGVIGVSGMFINGSTDAWFGGWGGSYITIEQAITIPACGTLTLTFESLCTEPSLTLDICIGGVPVAGGSLTCDGSSMVTNESITLTGLTPGASSITIKGTETAAGGNWFIDNVSLVSSDCFTEGDCDVVVMADYNCVENAVCPTVTAASGNQDVCNGGDADLTDATTGFAIATDPDNTAGTLAWTTDGNPPAADGSNVTTGTGLTNATCATETVTLTAWLLCTVDNSYIASGSITVTVYPDPASFAISVTASTGCGVAPVIMDSTCPTLTSEGWQAGGPVDGCTATGTGPTTDTYNWVQTPPAFAATAPAGCVYPDASGNEMVTGCEMCNACPTVTAASGNQDACNGGNADLTDATTGFAIATDPDGTAVNLVWTNDGNAPAADGSNVTTGAGLTNMTCTATMVTLSAWLECDNALDGFANPPGSDDSYIASGSITVNVYPVLTATDVSPAGCGMLQVDLVAMDGSVCDSETQACVNDGDVLNADFSASVTDPLGCSSLTATSAACSNCTMQSGNNAEAGELNCCDPTPLKGDTGGNQ